ncbi:MAG: hypothetical protein P8Y48_09415 [Novosphingobium sp.]
MPLVICPSGIAYPARIPGIAFDPGRIVAALSLQRGDPRCKERVRQGKLAALSSISMRRPSKSFKVGDTASFPVNGSPKGFPFVGTPVEVYDDHVMMAGYPQEPEKLFRGTRERSPRRTTRKSDPARWAA